MPDPTIRLAIGDDISQLVQMRREFTFEDINPTEVVRNLDFEDDCQAFLEDGLTSGRWQIWIAEVDEQIVAHAFVAFVDKVPRPIRERRRIAYLTNVYTRPPFRRRGIGRQLLRHAQEAAHQADVELMVVWPSDESVAFYEREGFGNAGQPMVWHASPSE